MNELKKKLSELEMIGCDKCEYNCLPPLYKIFCPKDVDQVVPLLPDIEQAKQKMFDAGYQKCLEDNESQVEQAKHEEKERIIDIFNDKLRAEYQICYNTPANVELLSGLFKFLQAHKGEDK